MAKLPHQIEIWLLWASGVSLLLLLASVALAPLVIARLPEDYFLQRARPATARDRRGLKLLRSAVRNALGGVLVFLGVLMLVLPGQGILTILAGLLVMRFPAKRRMLVRALSGTRARRSLNYLRKKVGRPPLRFPEEPTKEK